MYVSALKCLGQSCILVCLWEIVWFLIAAVRFTFIFRTLLYDHDDSLRLNNHAEGYDSFYFVNERFQSPCHLVSQNRTGKGMCLLLP